MIQRLVLFNGTFGDSIKQITATQFGEHSKAEYIASNQIQFNFNSF